MPKLSLRKSINEMCKSCIYDPKAEGSCIRQITDCTAPECPLFPVRPRLKKRGVTT